QSSCTSPAGCCHHTRPAVSRSLARSYRGGFGLSPEGGWPCGGRGPSSGGMTNGSGPRCPRWQVPQVTGAPEESILLTYFMLMSSVMLNIARAVAFSGLESSAKLSLGRPLGAMLLGSAVWQVLQCAPSEPSHCSIMSRTCCPVRFLGSTFRLVGAGKVRAGDEGLPAAGCVDCGVWAAVTAATATAAQRMAAQNRENGFKLGRLLVRWESCIWFDASLPKAVQLTG